uniref:Uncharacterized protein n=1 Tax=Cacopsylla melanoneura TaxID=428564 RepID=A0A8D9ASY6_9HEMI
MLHDRLVFSFFFFQTEQMECAIHILYTELPIYLHYTCIVSINPYINKIFTNIMVHNWNTEFNMTRNNSSLFSKICPDLFHDDKTLNNIHNLLLIYTPNIGTRGVFILFLQYGNHAFFKTLFPLNFYLYFSILFRKLDNNNFEMQLSKLKFYYHYIFK